MFTVSDSATGEQWSYLHIKGLESVPRFAPILIDKGSQEALISERTYHERITMRKCLSATQKTPLKQSSCLFFPFRNVDEQRLRFRAAAFKPKSRVRPIPCFSLL
jgi:hypothetical protein